MHCEFIQSGEPVALQHRQQMIPADDNPVSTCKSSKHFIVSHSKVKNET